MLSPLISSHAIQRFQQRFDRTCQESAKLGIEVLLVESRGLSLAEIVALKASGGWRWGHAYLFHDFSGLLIVIRFNGLRPVVCTVYAPDCLKPGK